MGIGMGGGMAPPGLRLGMRGGEAGSTGCGAGVAAVAVAAAVPSFSLFSLGAAAEDERENMVASSHGLWGCGLGWGCAGVACLMMMAL